jgi:hypothetical protein
MDELRSDFELLINKARNENDLLKIKSLLRQITNNIFKELYGR